jgi:hypothetical protein
MTTRSGKVSVGCDLNTLTNIFYVFKDDFNAEDEDEGAERDEYEPETLALEDTDLSSPDARSTRDILLERLYEATDKDFGHHTTEELRAFWKAYSEDQEAGNDAEVEYPQECFGSIYLSPGLT